MYAASTHDGQSAKDVLLVYSSMCFDGSCTVNDFMIREFIHFC